METNVNYTVVGAFVIILLTCVILTIIWLSVGFSFVEYNLYRVNMEESVAGLGLDSPVEFNGVNVGSVKSIQINPKEPQQVEILLSINESTPVTKGTVAMLNIKGLTGVASVALVDKGKDLTPLRPSPDNPCPIIHTAPSFLLRIDTAMSNLNENMHQLSQSLRSLLNKKNLDSIEQTLSNLKTITETLSVNREQLGIFLQNVSTLSQTLKTQTLPATNSALSSIDNMTTNFSIMSQQVKQNPSILIRGTISPPLGPGESP